ncbi:MAG: hypothetical protein QM765_17790 [Myxococcales bacterium]
MADQVRCKKHPAVDAGWTCNWCHAPLCPDCTALSFAGGGSPVPQCCLCGGQAQPILRKRSDFPYLQRLPGALVFPLSKSGLLTILAAGLVVYVFRLAGFRGAVFAQAILWTYVFSLIRAAANGKTEIEPPDISGLGDIFGPAFHGGLATMIVWLPALLYGIFIRPAVWPEAPPEYDTVDVRKIRTGGAPSRTRGAAVPTSPTAAPAQPTAEEAAVGGEEGFDEGTPDQPDAIDGAAIPAEGDQVAPEAAPSAPPKAGKGPPPLLLDPFLWLILLFGVFYAPMSLTIAASGGSWLDMLNPIRVFAVARRVPGDYAVLVGTACAVVLMMGFASVLGSLVDRIPIPVIPGWIAGMISTYPALVAGQAFGLFLYVRGAEIGYLPPGEAFEQTGSTAVPRGVAPGTSVATSPAPSPAAAAAEPVGSPLAARFGPAVGAAAASPAPAGQDDSRYAPIALDDEPSAAPAAAPVPLPQALQKAIAAKDLARVAQLYSGAQEPLPAALHYEVGRAAGGAGNNALALQALKAVVQVAPQDPLAPRALVLAARIYGERMKDAATAARIYSHVVARYPGTEAATFAQQRLSAAPPPAPAK